ncbi:MAG: putative toxin-antitoxin system toxin component, PIN family [Elusimicrobia bacterium]|nr:putative toxin-antitoxin system toxin component, PIN family [Elusimicrobiota bacterium]
MAGLKPRVVLDTNVIISSFWGGKPGEIVDLWKDGRILLIVSLPILKEYLAVCARFGLADAQLKERGLLFLESPFSTLVHARSEFSVIQEDLPDNRFLECAVDGGANFIVSGDQHLLRLKVFQKIPILSPIDFLKRLSEGG